MFNIYEDTEVPHIVCENFLPTHMVNKLYDGIGEMEEEFGHSFINELHIFINAETTV